MEWRTICSVPTDGSRSLLRFAEGQECIGRYEGGGWWRIESGALISDDCLTGWRPLPAPQSARPPGAA